MKPLFSGERALFKSTVSPMSFSKLWQIWYAIQDIRESNKYYRNLNSKLSIKVEPVRD